MSLTRAGVRVSVALDHAALVNPHEGQLAELLDDGFERHADQRVFVALRERDLGGVFGFAFDFLVVDVRDHDGAVQRAGQVVPDRIEQFLHAFVAIRRTHHHWRDLLRERRFADQRANFLDGDFALFEQRFHQFVIEQGQRFEHFLPRGRGLLDIAFGDRFAAGGFPIFAIKVDRLHRDEVDDTREIRLGTHRKLDGHRRDMQLFLDLLSDFERVGSDAVHLVDERDARDAIPLHLAIDGQRLALHAADGAQHQHGSVEHAQRAFDFDGEVHVARRVDQVDGVVTPLHLRRGGGDGDALLAFQFHVVHRGSTVAAFDLVHHVNAAGVKQDPLRERRLAGVDVGRDTNVSDF